MKHYLHDIIYIYIHISNELYHNHHIHTTFIKYQTLTIIFHYSHLVNFIRAS